MVQAREQLFRAKLLIRSQCLTVDNKAVIPYYFLDDKYVKKLLVSSWHQEMLARGKLAIVKMPETEGRYYITQKQTTQLIREIAPDCLVLEHNEIDDLQDEFDK